MAEGAAVAQGHGVHGAALAAAGGAVRAERGDHRLDVAGEVGVRALHLAVQHEEAIHVALELGGVAEDGLDLRIALHPEPAGPVLLGGVGPGRGEHEDAHRDHREPHPRHEMIMYGSEIHAISCPPRSRVVTPWV